MRKKINLFIITLLMFISSSCFFYTDPEPIVYCHQYYAIDYWGYTRIVNVIDPHRPYVYGDYITLTNGEVVMITYCAD